MENNLHMHRNVYLDFVRIFAALMIVSVHIGLSVGFDFGVGAMAVKLFFIMSGYFAFLSMERYHDAIVYYRNRILRIVPLYYFTLILLFLENIVFAAYYGKWTDAFSGADGLRFLRYFLFLQCIIPSDNWYMWNNQIGLWTMSAFFVFYMIAPVLYKILQSLKTSICALVIYLFVRKVVVITLTKVLVGYPESAGIEYFVTSNPASVMHCFLFGIVIYHALKEKRAGIMAGVLCVLMIVTYFQHFSFEFIYSILLIIAAYFGEELVVSERTKNIVSWFSNGTFALYMLHMLIISAAQMIWYKVGIESKVLHAVYLYVLSIVGSYVIYYGIVVRIERVIKNEWNKKTTIERPSV